MDLIKELNKDLEQGFSKRDLERLIGLPENTLSGVLSGKRKLSRKSKIKTEKWAVSQKPDPLNLPTSKNKKGIGSLFRKEIRFVYKFESMFRGQQVIIEYGLCNYGKEIDYAIISKDTPNFVHPNYEIFDDFLDEFHQEVWNITKEHLCKVTDAPDVFL